MSGGTFRTFSFLIETKVTCKRVTNEQKTEVVCAERKEKKMIKKITNSIDIKIN